MCLIYWANGDLVESWTGATHYHMHTLLCTCMSRSCQTLINGTLHEPNASNYSVLTPLPLQPPLLIIWPLPYLPNIITPSETSKYGSNDHIWLEGIACVCSWPFLGTYATLKFVGITIVWMSHFRHVIMLCADVLDMAVTSLYVQSCTRCSVCSKWAVNTCCNHQPVWLIDW